MYARIAAGLGHRHGSEPKEAAWSVPTEERVALAFAELDEVDLETNDCRTTLCLVEVSHGAMSSEELVHHVSRQDVFSGQVFLYYGGEYAVARRMRMFVARSGHDLNREAYVD